MIRAYDEMCLDDAMECLGVAVEYATFSCDMDGQEFLDLFVASGVASEFGWGNVKFISGMSGIELARHVLIQGSMEVNEYTDVLHGIFGVAKVKMSSLSPAEFMMMK